MAVTTSRPATDSAADPASHRDLDTPSVTNVAVAGLVAAVTAAVFGLLIVTLPVLLVWVGSSNVEAGGGQALRLALQTWLLAHGTSLRLGAAASAGSVAIAPLGLTALFGALVGATVRRAARSVGVGDRGARRVLVTSTAGAYAVVAVALSGLASARGLQPLASRAALGAAALAALSGWLSTRSLVGGSASPSPRQRLVRAAAVGGGAAVLALLAAGSLLAAVMVLSHTSRIGVLLQSLTPGAAGGAALVTISLLLVPNAAVWGLAYLAGPGFAVGVGTTVSPFAVRLAAVPDFPLLGALPGSEPPDGVALPLLLLPLAAGVLAGVLAVHACRDFSERRQLLAAALTAPFAGALALLGCALAGGSLGPGRLRVFGPTPWLVAVTLAVEVGVAATLTAWALPPRLRLPLSRGSSD